MRSPEVYTHLFIDTVTGLLVAGGVKHSFVPRLCTRSVGGMICVHVQTQTTSLLR